MAEAQEPAPDPRDPAGPAAGDGHSTGPAGQERPAAEDVKARFRDALERKKSQHADGVAGGGPNAAKIGEAHGRVGGKRQFRRKSGG